MVDQLISFETAKLARDKGCILENCRCGGFPTCICTANTRIKITQSLLQKWLREVHDIYLFVENILVDSSIMYQHVLTSDLIEEDSEDDIIFDTYEEALENGLQEALKLIKI